MEQAEPRIRVVVVDPGRPPEVREVDNTVEAAQEIVGGYVAFLHLERGVKLVMNEDATRSNTRFSPNRWVGNDLIRGPFFISKEHKVPGTGIMVSLSDEEVAFYMQRFAEVPDFAR